MVHQTQKVKMRLATGFEQMDHICGYQKAKLVIVIVCPVDEILIKDHPFMTFTQKRRGPGIGGRMQTGGGGSAPRRSPYRKLEPTDCRLLMRSCFFLKEFRF